MGEQETVIQADVFVPDSVFEAVESTLDGVLETDAEFRTVLVSIGSSYMPKGEMYDQDTALVVGYGVVNFFAGREYVKNYGSDIVTICVARTVQDAVSALVCEQVQL